MDSQNTLPIKKLLVAEDNESNFLLVMTILKRDYQIIHALDGLEAIQKYRQYSPDAILMDLKMPNMDGLEATREIRKLNTGIPIIVVSAFAFDSDKQEANKAGCTDIPYETDRLSFIKRNSKKYLS
ncbi:MAG: response regulator [Butyricimonas faecihominis]